MHEKSNVPEQPNHWQLLRMAKLNVYHLWETVSQKDFLSSAPLALMYSQGLEDREENSNYILRRELTSLTLVI